MRQDLASLLAARQGHFLLESGHHGDLWLDLEVLCLRPTLLRRFVTELAGRLSRHGVDAICGPLVEGAFIALMVAGELDVDFTYSERIARPQNGSLFPVEYRVPGMLRDKVPGRRIAIVNDVINAGSAVRGTFADLKECGAQTVAIGALLTLGSSAARFAEDQQVSLESLESLPNNLWTPVECPLCAGGAPLQNVGAF